MDIDEAVEKWTVELVGYLKAMRGFEKSRDTYEILCSLSAMSARASYFRNRSFQANHPKLNRLRLDVIDPFLEEVERQFKIWSRVQTVNQHEYTLAGGGA